MGVAPEGQATARRGVLHGDDEFAVAWPLRQTQQRTIGRGQATGRDVTRKQTAFLPGCLTPFMGVAPEGQATARRGVLHGGVEFAVAWPLRQTQQRTVGRGLATGRRHRETDGLRSRLPDPPVVRPPEGQATAGRGGSAWWKLSAVTPEGQATATRGFCMAMLVSPLPRGPGNGETRGFCMARVNSPLPGPYEPPINPNSLT